MSQKVTLQKSTLLVILVAAVLLVGIYLWQREGGWSPSPASPSYTDQASIDRGLDATSGQLDQIDRDLSDIESDTSGF